MDGRDNSDGAELVTIYWEMRASDGALMTCARYRTADGEDVRLGDRDRPVLRLQWLSDGDSGEEMAEHWRRQLIAGGSLEPPSE